jgi:hypothetical protein
LVMSPSVLSASFVTTAPGAEGSILPCGVGIDAWIQNSQ